MKISWMRNTGTINCQGIVSGLVDLCEYLKERGCSHHGLNVSDGSVMYEIGSFAGESAEIFSPYFDQVHCVDTWDYSIFRTMELPPGHPNCDEIEPSFDERAAQFGLIKHKSTSLEYANRVSERSVDFVYIDSEHDYINCRNDVLAWWPKVKIGGFMGGHDYQESLQSSTFRVFQVVQEFIASDKSATDLRLFADTSWIVRKT